MRTADIQRKTAETDISLLLNLDGCGQSSIRTGCGFLDHMLTLFARHGQFDLTVRCEGDTYVDDHHSVEDVGICLGQAFRNALGDRRGVNRYGQCFLPMDEALVLTAVDLSGRAHLSYGLTPPTVRVGTFDVQLVEEFLLAFVREAAITLHIKQLDGRNTHHILEAGFKSLARSLKQATAIDPNSPDEIPSTKGVLA